MGSSISHKTTIINKIVLQKKDPATTARDAIILKKLLIVISKILTESKLSLNLIKILNTFIKVTGIANMLSNSISTFYKMKKSII